MPNDTAIIDLSNAQTKRLLLDFIKNAKGIWSFEMRRCRKQRTLNQNAYLHASIFPIIAKGLSEAWGYTVDPGTTKEFLKDKFLKEPLINKNTGEVQGYLTRRTRDLSVTEAIAFIDSCIDFAGEWLCIPPNRFDPRPEFRMEDVKPEPFEKASA